MLPCTYIVSSLKQKLFKFGIQSSKQFVCFEGFSNAVFFLFTPLHLVVITAVHSDTTNLDHSELNQNSPFHHQPVQPNDNVDFCSKSQIINSISVRYCARLELSGARFCLTSSFRFGGRDVEDCEDN